jgi:magnesium transporter
MRKRTPWLILLLIGQTFTTIALLGFESLPLFAVLVLFMPLVNSPAGNAGSQMAGLMIRGLALQEIEMSDWAGVLLRELLRGLAFGVSLAVLGFGAARILGAYSAGMQPGEILPIAMGVSIAIATAVTLANVVGAMLPFFFKMVGLDPAVTSGPFIASVMDVSGILIYFTVATAIVGSLG